MKFNFYFVAFSLFWKMSSCIKCHRCVPDTMFTDTMLCQDFNGSDTTLTDCKESTMCFKRVTTLTVNGVSTITVRRGCALQTSSGYQEKINRKWQSVTKIFEPYKEECNEDTTDAERPIKIINCYCRGDRCNRSSNILNSSVVTFLITIIMLLIS